MALFLGDCIKNSAKKGPCKFLFNIRILSSMFLHQGLITQHKGLLDRLESFPHRTPTPEKESTL